MSRRTARKGGHHPCRKQRRIHRAPTCEQCGLSFKYKPLFNEEHTCLCRGCHRKAARSSTHYAGEKVEA